MRIGVVSALAPIGRDGVSGYGGIERGALWLANELASRGHEVRLFGNVEPGPSRFGWTGVPLLSESDALSPDHLGDAMSCGAVIDWSHSKPLRAADLERYAAVTMWTDVRARLGRDIYPSEAVRAAFKDPKAPVVPIGLPVAGLPPPEEANDYLVCFGRISPIKGTDLAVAIARLRRRNLAVAGHTGPYADAYFSLAVQKACRDASFRFYADPPDDEVGPLIGGAWGMLHTHRWIESFSIAAAEALCRGVPILTTDVGAPQEWVRAVDGGRVTPLSDLEEGLYSDAQIEGFFEEDWAPRREGIAKRARELFDVRRTATRCLEVLGVA